MKPGNVDWNKVIGECIEDKYRVDEKAMHTSTDPKHTTVPSDDISWRQAFHEVIEEGKLDDVEAMLANNPSLLHQLYRGSSWIHHAAVHGQAPIVEILIKQGLGVDAPNRNGEPTLYSIFLDAPSFEVLEVLLQAGSDINFANSKSKDSILHRALISTWDSYEDALLRILQQGANVNVFNANGYTPLHNAIEYGDMKCALMLLEYGARPDLSVDNHPNAIDYGKSLGTRNDMIEQVQAWISANAAFRIVRDSEVSRPPIRRLA